MRAKTGLAILVLFAGPVLAQQVKSGTGWGTVTLAFKATPQSQPHENIAYTYCPKVVGGAGTSLTYSISSGTLPSGLTLNASTGCISGTATATTSESITEKVVDPLGQYSTQNFTLTPATPTSIVIDPTSMTVAVSSTVPFNTVTVNWSDGTNEFGQSYVTWSSSATGVATAASAGVTGVAQGSANVTASFDGTTSNTLAVTVPSTGTALAVSTGSLPLNSGGTDNAQINQLYPQFTFTATGGSGTGYTWSTSVGSWPAGMSLSTAGILSGTPTASGSFSVTVEVTDSLSNTATKPITFTVAAFSNLVSALNCPSSLAINTSGNCTATANYSDGSTGNVTNLGTSSGSGTPVVGTGAGSFNRSTGTSFTANLTIPSGSFVGCIVNVFTGSTGISVTNSASQSFVQQGSVESTGDADTYVYTLANSSAATSVTASWTSGTGGGGLYCLPVSNLGTSSPADGFVINGGYNSGTSLSSSALTTTNANDVLINWLYSFSGYLSTGTVGSGYTMAPGSGNNLGAQYQMVSSAQSAVKALFTLGGNNAYDWVSDFGGYKAAASGGTGWACTGQCASVSGSGVVTASSVAGSITVSATLGSSTATGTITVTSSSAFTLTVTPATQSASIGGSVSYTATGSDGSNYTSAASWSAQTPSIASNSGSTFTCLTSGTTAIYATYNGATGSASLTCGTVATGDLLAGATVTTSGVVGSTQNGSPAISVATPSGWTLVAAENFAGGVQHASDLTQLHGLGGGAQIECTFAHSPSTCAYQAGYSSNGQSFRWILDGGATGTSTEIYVSWWEYVDSTTRLNEEMYLAQAVQNIGTNPQFDILDWWGSDTNCLNGAGPGPSYNCENAQIVISPQSNASGGINNAMYSSFLDANMGTWRQYEWHFKANTSGNSDGTADLYINGQLFQSWTGENWNGTFNMAGMEVDVGGTYTSWKMADSGNTTCYNAYGGTGIRTSCSPFTLCNPPCPAPPSFNRYWDDIIVLKK